MSRPHDCNRHRHVCAQATGYRIDIRHGTVWITFSAPLTRTLLAQLMDDLAARRAPERRLFDLRGSSYRMTGEEVAESAAYAGSLVDTHRRIALLIGESDLDLFPRLYLALGGHDMVEADLFTDEDEACRWLDGPDSPQGAA
ncbi:MAG: hypothetical protein R3E86_15560 [Pseudomonadales bacterium]